MEPNIKLSPEEFTRVWTWLLLKHSAGSGLTKEGTVAGLKMQEAIKDLPILVLSYAAIRDAIGSGVPFPAGSQVQFKGTRHVDSGGFEVGWEFSLLLPDGSPPIQELDNVLSFPERKG